MHASAGIQRKTVSYWELTGSMHMYYPFYKKFVFLYRKFYIQNEMYITHKFALKLADEGLVIYSVS